MATTPEQPTPLSKESEAKDRGLAIVATPLENEKVLFQRSVDGGMTIKFKGEVAIALSPKVSEASDAVLKDTSGVPYGLIPEGSPEPRREPQNVSEKKADNPTPETNGGLNLPESENRKHEIVGNVVYNARFRERKSGKKIADFHIATHPNKNETVYYRIRAFDDLAEKVRDTVRKGQKDVEVVAYGPKHWRGKKRTKDEWTDEVVTGYYAGFVRVPKDNAPKQETEKSPKQDIEDSPKKAE
jgi:hypothetical protein